MVGFDIVRIRTVDGVDLNVYKIENKSDVDIIVLHGSRMSVKKHSEICRSIARESKCNVITMFYRGYGGNTGRPSELNLMIDVRALFDYVVRLRYNKKIGIFGQSLGCGTSLYFASLFDDSYNLAIILENPFFCYRDLLKKKAPYKFVYFLAVEDWPNNTRVQRIANKSVLFLSAEEDALVPPGSSERLKEVSNRSKLYVMRGANHFNGHMKVPNFYEVIANFVRESFKMPSA
jgi:pimeloyl-ACP methyl ester carboxylesterase